MIYESYGYKTELLAIHARLLKRERQKKWVDQTYFLTEKDFFVGFFLIRKLIEAKTKLTPAVSNQKAKLIKYQPLNKTPNNYNRLDFAELYDLENPHNITKSATFVCNLAIHSFIYTPIFDEAKLVGFFLNSDKEKLQALYQISLHEALRLFDSFGTCHITSAIMRRTADGGFEISEATSGDKNKSWSMED